MRLTKKIFNTLPKTMSDEIYKDYKITKSARSEMKSVIRKFLKDNKRIDPNVFIAKLCVQFDLTEHRRRTKK